MVPVSDTYPTGQRCHTHSSPSRYWCNGHGFGVAGACVVGMYQGRQIQKISSNSYLKPFTSAQTHLLFTFSEPSGQCDRSTATHSSLSATYTLPSPHTHAGNEPSLPFNTELDDKIFFYTNYYGFFFNFFFLSDVSQCFSAHSVIPFGHFANKYSASKTVAQMRFTASYGLSSLQIHFGCFPLLLNGHNKSSATALATSTNAKVNTAHFWNIRRKTKSQFFFILYRNMCTWDIPFTQYTGEKNIIDLMNEFQKLRTIFKCRYENVDCNRLNIVISYLYVN